LIIGSAGRQDIGGGNKYRLQVKNRNFSSFPEVFGSFGEVFVNNPLKKYSKFLGNLDFITFS